MEEKLFTDGLILLFRISGLLVLLLLIAASLYGSISLKKRCIEIQATLRKGTLFFDLAALGALGVWVLEYGYHWSQPHLNSILIAVAVLQVIRQFLTSFDFVYLKRSFAFIQLPTYITIILLLFFTDTSAGRAVWILYIGWICALFTTKLFWDIIKSSSIGMGILFSFLILILLGAFLLQMPHFSKGSIPFVDTLFVSTSALCVTGLSTIDVGKKFTESGQFILMLLYQIGGLGPVTLLVLISSLMSKYSSARRLSLIKDVFSLESMSEIKMVMITILGVSIVSELIGALLIYYFDTGGHSFFWALFHSVSAFCNAGFSLERNSMVGKSNEILLVLSALIVAGGLGFPIYFDLFRWSKYHIKKRFGKIKTVTEAQSDLRFRHLQVQTLLAIKVTAALIVVGALLFTALEWNHTISKMSVTDGFINIFFQSISFRTAGFNSLDLNSFSIGSQLVTFIYMIIGAGSLSTGGGVKVLTMVIVGMTVLSYMRGNPDVVLGPRRVATATIKIAVSIISLYMLVLIGTVFMLAVFEKGFSLLQITYESVSALSTVGVSLGITDKLSSAGKYVIMVAMIFGRIGPITLIVMVFKSKSRASGYRYPKAHFTLG